MVTIPGFPLEVFVSVFSAVSGTYCEKIQSETSMNGQIFFLFLKRTIIFKSKLTPSCFPRRLKKIYKLFFFGLFHSSFTH